MAVGELAGVTGVEQVIKEQGAAVLTREELVRWCFELMHQRGEWMARAELLERERDVALEEVGGLIELGEALAGALGIDEGEVNFNALREYVMELARQRDVARGRVAELEELVGHLRGRVRLAEAEAGRLRVVVELVHRTSSAGTGPEYEAWCRGRELEKGYLENLVEFMAENTKGTIPLRGTGGVRYE